MPAALELPPQRSTERPVDARNQDCAHFVFLPHFLTATKIDARSHAAAATTAIKDTAITTKNIECVGESKMVCINLPSRPKRP